MFFLLKNEYTQILAKYHTIIILEEVFNCQKLLDLKSKNSHDDSRGRRQKINIMRKVDSSVQTQTFVIGVVWGGVTF